MKTIIKIIMIALLFTSCEQKEELVNIDMSFTYQRIFKTKEQLYKARESEPTTATVITDKGVFEFDLTPVNGGSVTNIIQITPDTYVIEDILLYDEDNELIYGVHKGVPEQSSMIVSWLNGQEYEINKDRFFAWQVWIK